MGYIKKKRAIKAEIRKFFGIPDINKIAKDIETLCGNFLSFSAITSPRKKYKSWQLKLQLLVLYEKYRASNIVLRSSEEVDEFIDILNSVCQILKNPDTPKPVKAMIEDFYKRRINTMVNFWPDEPGTKELFARRNEIPKDNPFFFCLADAMVDYEVFKRFYEKKPKEKDPDKMTQKELLRYQKSIPKEKKEWDGRYNRLCKKYGLNELSRHTS